MLTHPRSNLEASTPCACHLPFRGTSSIPRRRHWDAEKKWPSFLFFCWQTPSNICRYPKKKTLPAKIHSWSLTTWDISSFRISPLFSLPTRQVSRRGKVEVGFYVGLEIPIFSSLLFPGVYEVSVSVLLAHALQSPQAISKYLPSPPPTPRHKHTHTHTHTHSSMGNAENTMV